MTTQGQAFDAHAGAAFSTFRHDIYEPYRTGRLSHGAAGAAARLAARELRLAATDAARSPQLKPLAVPLTLLAGRMGALAPELSTGRFEPADIDAANASVTEITAQARADGLSVADARGPTPAPVSAAPRPAATAAGAHICLPAALRVHVALSAPVYASGQRVPISVTARDAGRAACLLPTGSCLPEVLVIDRNGTVVWNRAQTQVVCQVATLRLGRGRTARRTVAWNSEQCAGRTPQTCTGRAVPPGTYRAAITWDTVKPAFASIKIR